MYAKVTIYVLASLCMARGYVIIGSKLYNTAPPLPYIAPSAATPSQEYVQSPQEYVQPSQEYVQSPQEYVQSPQEYVQSPQKYVQSSIVSPVKSVSKVTYEVPLSEKDEHSDEVVIAGPSGVIKTHRKSSKPVLAQHTTKVVTKNFIQPQPQLQFQPQTPPQPQPEPPQAYPQVYPEVQLQPQTPSETEPQSQPQPPPQPQQIHIQTNPEPITYFTSPVVRIEHDQIPNDFHNTDFNPEAFLLQV